METAAVDRTVSCSFDLNLKVVNDYLRHLVFFNLEYQLCDAFRPGHFEGVITIVMKLCNIIQPHYLFLGKKDYQQLFILKKVIVF